MNLVYKYCTFNETLNELFHVTIQHVLITLPVCIFSVPDERSRQVFRTFFKGYNIPENAVSVVLNVSYQNRNHELLHLVNTIQNSLSRNSALAR